MALLGTINSANGYKDPSTFENLLRPQNNALLEQFRLCAVPHTFAFRELWVVIAVDSLNYSPYLRSQVGNLSIANELCREFGGLEQARVDFGTLDQNVDVTFITHLKIDNLPSESPASVTR